MDTSIFDVGALGHTGQFSELLEFLRSADYTDEFICRRICTRRSLACFHRFRGDRRLQTASGSKIISSNCGEGKSPGT